MVRKHNPFFLSLLLVACSLCITTVAAAQDKPAKALPKTEKAKDFDDVLMQLEKAEADLQKSLKEVDWNKIEQDIKTSLQQASAGMAKAQEALQKELKELDTEKIKAEIGKATQELKAVDMSQLKADLQASLTKVDMEKIRQEIGKVKEVDLEKVRAELEKAKPEMEKAVQKAKESIEKAKVEIKEYQTFVNALADDGLIKKNEAYTIEIKSDRLIINGQEQPAAVFNKHRTFLEKHKGTTIKKTADDLNIQKD
jgi:chromosome segregation ATPase